MHAFCSAGGTPFPSLLQDPPRAPTCPVCSVSSLFMRYIRKNLQRQRDSSERAVWDCIPSPLWANCSRRYEDKEMGQKLNATRIESLASFKNTFSKQLHRVHRDSRTSGAPGRPVATPPGLCWCLLTGQESQPVCDTGD